MLVVEHLQPVVLSQPQISFTPWISSLWKQRGGSSTAEAQGEGEGTRMAVPVPRGLTMQRRPPQLHSSLGCTNTCHGGKPSLPEAAALSLASSVSWGAELSAALSSWVSVSPHPAWLTRDAVKSWGCPLLITHRGAEAFIMVKALLAHSIPLASPRARCSGCAISPLHVNCTPCSLPICKALLSRTVSLAPAQGKVPFAATWGTGSSREGQILIALVLPLQIPKHQQLLQTLSCPLEVG